jgi:hypothetical protein
MALSFHFCGRVDAPPNQLVHNTEKTIFLVDQDQIIKNIIRRSFDGCSPVGPIASRPA